MATLTTTTPAAAPPRTRGLGAEIAGWAQESLYATPWQALGNALLALAAFWVWRGQLLSAPAVALVVGGLWAAGLVWVVISALRRRYDVAGQWLKDRLFYSPASALLTLIIALVIVAAAVGLFNWAVADASFTTDPAVARSDDQNGATWGVVAANLKLFLTGQYPAEAMWRVWLSLGLLAGLAVLAWLVFGPAAPRFQRWRRLVVWLWLLSPIVTWVLVRGVGQAGPLPVIETRFWGGLLLTIIITIFATVVSFPLGVLLALGRRSQLPGIPALITLGVAGLIAAWGLVDYTLPNLPLARSPLEYVLVLWPVWLLVTAILFQRVYRGNTVAAASTVFIEFVRGVPLITVLFMAQLLLPLFVPANFDIENAYRAMWGFALFSAAYMAENVRGGLQSIPRGQYEAAQALGLNTFQQLRFVILPQALRVVIPPITGQVIGLFKDTTLVAIVGLIDFLNVANAVIAQPDWLGLRREAYFFITIVYYIGCYAIARMGYWMERRTGLGTR